MNTPSSQVRALIQAAVVSRQGFGHPALPTVVWNGGAVCLPPTYTSDTFWQRTEEAALLPCYLQRAFVLVFDGWAAPDDTTIPVLEDPRHERGVFYWVWDDGWEVHGFQPVNFTDNGRYEMTETIEWMSASRVPKDEQEEHVALHLEVAQMLLGKDPTIDIVGYAKGLVAAGHSVVFTPGGLDDTNT